MQDFHADPWSQYVVFTSETTQGRIIRSGSSSDPVSKRRPAKWPGSSDRCWNCWAALDHYVFQERYEFHFWILPGLEHGLGISLGSLGPTLSCQPQLLWVSQDADMLFSEIRQLVWEKWEPQSVKVRCRCCCC